MNNEFKRKLQLAIGFTVFVIAVTISYFSTIEQESGSIKQDVFLVIDVSGSMADSSKLNFAKRAAFEFVDAMNLNSTSDNQVGLVSFGYDAYVIVDITGDSNALKQGISSLTAHGGTAMGDGIMAGMDSLDLGRPDARKTIVLLSDGVSNIGSSPLVAASEAAYSNVKIFSVGYGYDADVTTLRSMASVTDGEYFSASTGQDLARAFGKISEAIISPVSHYSSRIMMLVAIPVLLFIPAIEAGITTMMKMVDTPVRRNVSKRPCPHCQYPNRAAAKFCLKCGRTIGEKT